MTPQSSEQEQSCAFHLSFCWAKTSIYFCPCAYSVQPFMFCTKLIPNKKYESFVLNAILILELELLCSSRRWERLVSILVDTIGYYNKVSALSFSSLKVKETSYSLILEKAVTIPYQQEPHPFLYTLITLIVKYNAML